MSSEEKNVLRNENFYDEIDKDLRALEFRVNSIPDNSRTVELVKNIRRVILESENKDEPTSLKDIHMLKQNKEKGIDKSTLEVTRRNINQTISAALSLEIAKKRGSEK